MLAVLFTEVFQGFQVTDDTSAINPNPWPERHFSALQSSKYAPVPQSTQQLQTEGKTDCNSYLHVKTLSANSCLRCLLVLCTRCSHQFESTKLSTCRKIEEPKAVIYGEKDISVFYLRKNKNKKLAFSGAKGNRWHTFSLKGHAAFAW